MRNIRKDLEFRRERFPELLKAWGKQRRKAGKNMRVISQDGTIDLPYEQVIIQCFKKNIYFLNKNLIGVEQLICDRVVAKYSTEEKAKKAMEMLRIAYTGSIAMFQNVEPTEEVNEVFKKCNTQVIYASLDNQPSEIKFENHQNFYFQFPTEEELE